MSIGSRIPSSGIRVMMELARSYPEAINLSVGEPDFPTPPAIVEAAHQALLSGATKYTSTPGNPALRQAIADRAAARWGRPVEVGEVLVSVGAVGSLATALLAIVTPGDEVLLPDPGWPNYANLVLLAQANARYYPLDAGRGFVPDLAELEERMTERTTAIIINSPGNPTGAVWPAEIVDAVVEMATRRGITVISDEVYEDFTFDGPHASAATSHPEVVYVSGCSKSYAMTGWRLGFSVGPKSLINVMTRVQEPLVSCPPAVSQAAGLAALTGSQEPVAEMASAYRRRRDLLAGILEPEGLLPARPQGAFYALVDLSSTGLRGIELSQALLTEAGVVTVAGDSFGSGIDSMVRLSFATSDDFVVRGCEAIVEFVRKRKASAV